MREAVWLYTQGVASAEDIDEAMKTGFGFRTSIIGPFQTMDYNGLDVCHAISSYMFAELDNTETAPAFLQEMVAAGQLGVKSGRGFYDYKGAAPAEVVRMRDEGLLEVLRLQRSLAGAATRENGG